MRCSQGMRKKTSKRFQDSFCENDLKYFDPKEVLGPLRSDQSTGPLLQRSIGHCFVQSVSLDSKRRPQVPMFLPYSPPSRLPYVFSLSLWAFRSRDRRVMLVVGSLKVWSIHLDFHLRRVIPGPLSHLLIGDLHFSSPRRAWSMLIKLPRSLIRKKKKESKGERVTILFISSGMINKGITQCWALKIFLPNSVKR